MCRLMGRLEERLRKTIDDRQVPIFLILGIVLALLLRYPLLDFESRDYRAFLSKWYDVIKLRGFFPSFRYSFSNYTPLYLHMLAVATLLPIAKLHAIKFISIVFDFVAAVFAHRLVRERYPNSLLPAYAALAVLFAPTVFFNGALWGQCDVIYASMILASLFYLMRCQYGAALFLYGVSFSLKLQSLFILPVYVLLWLKREFSITKFLHIPFVYFLTIIPSLLAGRPLLDLIGIYFHQAKGRRVSMQAANLYQWFPRAERYFSLFNPAGLAFTAFVVLALLFIVHRGLRGRRMDRETLIQLALLSALVVPFFLPRMHERYFFLADLLSIVYAFYFPKHLFVPIAVILCSLFSYFPFLFGATFIELSYLALALLGIIVFITYDLLARIYKYENQAILRESPDVNGPSDTMMR